MILKGKYFKGINPLGATELFNCKMNCCFTKYLSIKIEITTLKVKVLHPSVCGSFFSKIILDTSWLSSAKTRGIYQGIWFEEGLEQVICDVAIFQ